MSDKFAGDQVLRDFNQMGVLVKDCVEAAKQWAEVFGAGPFIISRHIQIENLKYKGKQTTWDQDSAIGQWGPIQIELLQTNDDSLAVHYETPQVGGKLHHVNWVADDLDAETKRLEDLGYPMVWECTCQPGNMRIRWFDAEKLLGCLIEVYESNEFIEQTYDSIRMLHEDWDGESAIAYVYDCRTNQIVDEKL